VKDEQAKEYINKEVGERGVRWLNSKYAESIFAFIAFIESVIAPIIIDPFLIALILAKRERWIRYTIIATVFSVIGGLAGYLIGFLFYDFIGRFVIELYGLQDYFKEITLKINDSAFAFVLLGALTPIPYKLVAIASGLVELNLMTFLVASIIGRVLRMGMVGFATYALGERAMPFLRKHLYTLVSIFAVLLIVYIALRIWSPDLLDTLPLI